MVAHVEKPQVLLCSPTDPSHTSKGLKAGSQHLARNFYEIEQSEQARLQHSMKSGVISRSAGSSDKLYSYGIGASIEQGERNKVVG